MSAPGDGAEEQGEGNTRLEMGQVPVYTLTVPSNFPSQSISGRVNSYKRALCWRSGWNSVSLDQNMQ